MYTPGTVLAGKYRVEGILGRGGMGVVVAAEHIELRSRVALKFLAEKFIQHPHVTERFMREARACAQLRSEHICRVSDVGRLDTGVPYIVMELLEGRDLAKELRSRIALDTATAADYVHQACDAIIEAHAAQIIHRDLKPSNLFLTQRRDGSPLIKVLDFGVAKAQGESDLSLTSTANVVGSPSYMSPEQLRSSKGADARSDIWSLGIILHELVSGRPPFNGETVVDLAVRIAHEPPEPTTGTSPEFASIVARCLEKDPSLRFQTVRELAAALAPFAARKNPQIGERITTFLPPAQVAVAATPTTLHSASGVMQPAPIRGNGRRVVLISAIAAIALGVAGGLVFGPRGLSSESRESREPREPRPAQVTSPPSPVVVVAPAPVPAITPDALPAVVVVVTPDAAPPAETVADPAADAAVPTTGESPTPKPHPIKHPVPVKKRSKEEIGASRI